MSKRTERIKYLENQRNEIKKITHLVRIHDELDKIKTHEEQLVFEADTFGQIDVERNPPNFDKKSGLEYLDQEFEKKRTSFLKTSFGGTNKQAKALSDYWQLVPAAAYIVEKCVKISRANGKSQVTWIFDIEQLGFSNYPPIAVMRKI